MIKLIRSLILSAIIMLALASCNFFSSPTVNLEIKETSTGPYNAVGQPIKFSYTITNTGTESLLDPVKVQSVNSDGSIVIVTCPPINTPGNQDGIVVTNEIIVCNGEYLITQDDLNNGSVTNSALVEDAVTNGLALTLSLKAVPTNLTTVSPLTLTTTANPTTYDQVGQVITYTYTIQYNGAGSPGPIQFTVTDNPVSPTPFPCGTPYAPLPATQTVTCTRPYTITQADLIPVSITNIATASDGTLQSPSANFTINKAGNVLILTTTANPTTYDKAGQSITFKYEIKNNGTANLGPTQFTITDTLITPQTFNCGPAATTLTPGQTLPCDAPGPYLITADDMTAVSVANLASASDSPVTVTSQKVSATVNRSGPSATNLSPGATIQHKVVDGEWLWQIARCYGADPTKMAQANQQLSNPALIYRDMIVNVPNIGSVGTIYGPPCVVTHTVQTGDTWGSIASKYNADPTVLQMVNTSTLTPGSVIKVPINSAGAVTASKGLTLSITAAPSTYDQVGQVITFTYTIKNNGNTTLGPTQFMVSDSLVSPTPINCGNANTSLAPSLTMTCTATYTIKAEDLTAVSVTNIATASGGGAGPSPSANATINKIVKLLTLTTTAVTNNAANPSTYNQVGQVITFTYIIKNSGNVVLAPTQFTVTDTLVSATPINCGGATTILDPGLTVTCTATYTVNDLTAVSITSIATASGGGVGPSQAVNTTVTKQ